MEVKSEKIKMMIIFMEKSIEIIFPEQEKVIIQKKKVIIPMLLMEVKKEKMMMITFMVK